MRTIIYVYGYHNEEFQKINGKYYLKRMFNLKGNWKKESIEKFIGKRFNNVLVRVQFPNAENNFEFHQE